MSKASFLAALLLLALAPRAFAGTSLVGPMQPITCPAGQWISAISPTGQPFCSAAGGGPPTCTETFNPSASNASISFSNGNLTATLSSGSSYVIGMGNISHSTGKYYWEIEGNNFNAGNDAVGAANSGVNLSNYVGFDTHGEGFFFGHGFWYNNAQIFSWSPTYTAGDWIGIALDLTDGTIWVRENPSGQWNGSATANPATNTGGATFSPATPVFPAIDLFSAGDTLTANFGASPFAGTVPAGFTCP